MTDKHPEAIRVTLGDEVKTLKLSAAAIKIARLQHGRDDLTLGSLFGVAKDDIVPTLFWLGLLPDAPETTELDATVLLAQHEGAEEEVAEPLMARYSAMLRAFTEAQKNTVGKLIDEQRAEAEQGDGADQGKA